MRSKAGEDQNKNATTTASKSKKMKRSLLGHFKKKTSLVDTETELNIGAIKQSTNDSTDVSELSKEERSPSATSSKSEEEVSGPEYYSEDERSSASDEGEAAGSNEKESEEQDQLCAATSCLVHELPSSVTKLCWIACSDCKQWYHELCILIHSSRKDLIREMTTLLLLWMQTLRFRYTRNEVSYLNDKHEGYC